jgi:hypothetical protein
MEPLVADHIEEMEPSVVEDVKSEPQQEKTTKETDKSASANTMPRLSCNGNDKDDETFTQEDLRRATTKINLLKKRQLS